MTNLTNNPFTPNLNVVPKTLVGCFQILNDMEKTFNNWRNDPNICSLFIGPRGSGKTALLSVVGDMARKNGWIVVDSVSQKDMLIDIYQKISLQASEILPSSSKTKISSLNLGQILELSFDSQKEANLNWNNQFDLLISELSANDVGVLITIDEILTNQEDLSYLVSLYQLLRRKGLKLSLMLAGLPSNILNITSGDSTSFLRRATHYILGNLEDGDVRLAFEKTITNNGKKIERDALEKAVKEINGFPYMLQLLGYGIWEEANGNKTITLSHVNKGVEYAKARFTTSVLYNTFLELSNKDKEFLYAMLACGDVCSNKDLESITGKSSGYLSTYKKRLLSTGVIQELPGKKLSFALPFFKEYLKAQKDLEGK